MGHHPSPRLLRGALAVALILDISLPLTLGVVPGPGCVNCSWPAIASAWPATPQGTSSRDRFFVGESCFDLLALALLRALTLAACLAALSHRRTSARAPALEPLRAPPLPPPRPAPLFIRYAGRACALAALLYSAAKGFTRLLQSGEGHGVGFGLLVHAGTTPPALEFWLCLTGAALLAEAEARAYEGLILAAGAGRAQAWVLTPRHPHPATPKHFPCQLPSPLPIRLSLRFSTGGHRAPIPLYLDGFYP